MHISDLIPRRLSTPVQRKTTTGFVGMRYTQWRWLGRSWFYNERITD